MQQGKIIIFTDGSSRGNPGPGGYAYISIYPDSHGTFKIDEGGGKESLTTNNRMELRAAIEALNNFDGYFDSAENTQNAYHIYLDSAYVLNGITKWVFGWERNGWLTSQKEKVVNEDLWKELKSSTEGKKIEWHLLKGHGGIAGNERCDEIATAFADSVTDPTAEPSLFKGKASDYKIDIFNMEMSAGVSKSSKGKKAYSYVSSINGKVMIHRTWAECEARVKGEKGARFKKALSKSDEDELISTLGKI